MANILNTTPYELAIKVQKMEKEERFRQLKSFYLHHYPTSKEFYEHFSSKKKQKRENSCTIESVNKKILIEKSQNDEIEVANETNQNKCVDPEEEFSFENIFNRKQKEIDELKMKQEVKLTKPEEMITTEQTTSKISIGESQMKIISNKSNDDCEDIDVLFEYRSDKSSETRVYKSNESSIHENNVNINHLSNTIPVIDESKRDETNQNSILKNTLNNSQSPSQMTTSNKIVQNQATCHNRNINEMLLDDELNDSQALEIVKPDNSVNTASNAINATTTTISNYSIDYDKLFDDLLT